MLYCHYVWAFPPPFHGVLQLRLLANIFRYLIGQGIGSLIVPPWSESLGRKKLYVISGVFSLICCVFVAAIPYVPAVVLARLIGGFFSAVPYTVGGGSIEDMFGARSRIWVMYFWILFSNGGLVMGPIMGSNVTETLGWYVYGLSMIDKNY